MTRTAARHEAPAPGCLGGVSHRGETANREAARRHDLDDLINIRFHRSTRMRDMQFCAVERISQGYWPLRESKFSLPELVEGLRAARICPGHRPGALRRVPPRAGILSESEPGRARARIV